jgi:putative nucleotidyltransferase with HDIG domain
MSVSLLVAYALTSPPVSAVSGPIVTAIMAPILFTAAAASYRFPIHIRHNVKLYMAGVPLYLLAVCLPPVPAAALASGAVLLGELDARRHTGAFASDIVGNVARYCLVVLAASMVVHLPWPAAYPLHLVAGALAYWFIEAVTLPILITPMNGEPPVQVIRAYVSEAGMVEGMQYGIAILGGLLVLQYPWSLAFLAIPAGLVYGSFKNAKEIHETTVQMLESMADAVDLRDPYTGGHSSRVAEYSGAMLKQLNKGGPEAELVVSAARVHDIGKIGLPDSVLLKDGKLDPEEQAIMQTHPEAGAQLLRRYREFSRGIDIVRHHHERWDGHGYPSGLKATAIPWGARIVAVADSFDAMTSDRPYRAGMSGETARQILLQGRRTQWDPEVVDAFIPVLDKMIAATSVAVHRTMVDRLEQALAV